MKIRNFLFGLMCIVCLPVPALAFEVGIGASLNQKSLTINTADGQEISALEGDPHLWPYLSIKTDDKYFGDSSFGYFYYGWYSQASVDKVKNQSGRVLPSPVNMSFLYAGATAFYMFGNKHVSKENLHTQHVVGIGLGWGASIIEGTVPAAFTNTGVTENISSNLRGNSYNIFYRYMWEEMFFMFDANTVQVNNGSRRYDTGEFSLIFGRYFDL